MKTIVGENDFETVFPDIAKEFHPTMNGELTVHDISPRSNRKVYWICENQHIYYMSPDKRTQKKIGCSICANKKVLKGFNDVATRFPQIACDWDYEKNDKTPSDYTSSSTYSAWWICHECGHRWKSKIRDRADSGTFACPKCVYKIIGNKKSATALRTNGCITNPLLLEEWDYEKNKLGPENFTPNCGKYAWWICRKCGYSWKAKIGNRTNGRGCPLCAGSVVIEGINDLTTTHPELCEEWDYEKNAPLMPNEVSFGCNKKVGWVCPKGHKYMATIGHRSSGTNCPKCASGRQTSFAEQATFFYVKQMFPDAINRYQDDFLGRLELDIYIPSMKYAIEYDGIAWHGKEKLHREQRKYNICHENGIKLIRMREETPKLCLDNADLQIGRENLYEHKNLEEVINQLLDYFRVRFPSLTPVNVNIAKDKNVILGYSQELKGTSFETEYPELAKEWDYERNGELLPSMFKPHSDIVVAWKCSVCGNRYEASIGHRSYGTGCPKCGIIKSKRSSQKAVEMIDPNTNEVIKVFDSINDAGREMGINRRNISSVCKGVRARAGGYIWRYSNITENEE